MRNLTPIFLLCLLLVLSVIAAALGTIPIDVLAALFGEADAWQSVILWQVRLPRVVVAALVGGGLAVSGAVLQGLFRNPMADPSLLGISGGAALGAVLAIALGAATVWPLALPLLSFACACAVAFVVYSIATVRGHAATATLLLTGIAVGTFASSLTSLVLTMKMASWEVAREIVQWMMGGLEGKTWTDVWLGGPLILGGSLLLWTYSRALDVLATGEETALTLGVDVPRVRRDLLLLTSAVTAAAVAISGTLAFVGLMVPHLLRLIVGPSHRLLLSTTFLAGAALIVFADLVARTAFGAQEVRVGVLTALLGGPFFVFLLITNKARTEAL